MVHNLVHNLCESLVTNIGGVAGIGKKTPPTPITYLTQWRLIGNSEVHGVGNLTSWKVSGNSVVDNNTILSCGDLGQDGMYHVKISNGVNVYDIPLTAPLRKVNDVADTIEFPSDTEGKALVTRNLSSILIRNATLYPSTTNITGANRKLFIGIGTKPTTSNNDTANILCSSFETKSASNTFLCNKGISADVKGNIQIYDPDYNTTSDINDFKTAYADTEVIYELVTPTTELVDVSPFSVSPTDTYTSANVTPYSAFEHTENKEIWSCGEYNATDGKYHILVKPQGGSIADIALDEPLRKVNDVADTIEFPSGTEGKALVTRRILSQDMGSLSWLISETNKSGVYRMMASVNNIYKAVDNTIVANILCTIYNAIPAGLTFNRRKGCAVSASQRLFVYDPDYNQSDSVIAFTSHVNGYNIILELATPTTELVDAPQIAEAESYTCVISQGGRAVEWSSFNCGILYFYDKIIPTDNAYIDTGYIPSIDSKFVTHIKRVSLNHACLYSNASSGKTDGIRFLLAGDKYFVSFGSSRTLTEPNTNLDLTITHAHTEYLIINGNDNTYKTSVGNSYIAQPLTIFSDYFSRSISGATSYFNNNSLYSFKIYENDVLVRDFKPCTYNGVAGLWDMVESKFYGNSNSVGTLTASNDV